MSVRLILWILVMAWVGFFIAGGLILAARSDRLRRTDGCRNTILTLFCRTQFCDPSGMRVSRAKQYAIGDSGKHIFHRH